MCSKVIFTANKSKIATHIYIIPSKTQTLCRVENKFRILAYKRCYDRLLEAITTFFAVFQSVMKNVCNLASSSWKNEGAKILKQIPSWHQHTMPTKYFPCGIFLVNVNKYAVTYVFIFDHIERKQVLLVFTALTTCS